MAPLERIFEADIRNLFDTDAVSYTHLDVYKRQTLKIGLEKDDEQGCLAGLSVCLVSVFRFAACGECVSCKCKIGGFG